MREILIIYANVKNDLESFDVRKECKFEDIINTAQSRIKWTFLVTHVKSGNRPSYKPEMQNCYTMINLNLC